MRGLPLKIIEHKTSGKVPESASDSHPEKKQNETVRLVR